MKRTLLLVLLTLSALRVSAQESDSVHFAECHQISAAQFVAPSILITSGALIHYVDGLRPINTNVRDYVADQHFARIHVDDYLQYLPMAAAIGLEFAGLEPRHEFRDLLPLVAESYLIGGAVVLSVKELTHIQRPDASTFNSFPSGHTMTAFVGAEIIRREYGSRYPLLAVGGYAVATSVGLMRIYNSRHWVADVLSGAGTAILSVAAAYWTYPALNKWLTSGKCRLHATPLALTLDF